MRLKEKLQAFMAGRHGTDGFGNFLFLLSMILLVLSMFFVNVRVVHTILFLLALLVLIYSYFRVFSKNNAARVAENYKYYGVLNRIRSLFNKGYGADNTHKIYTCPGCKTKIRVPKNRGKIEITCKKCGAVFCKYTGRRK